MKNGIPVPIFCIWFYRVLILLKYAKKAILFLTRDEFRSGQPASWSSRHIWR